MFFMRLSFASGVRRKHNIRSPLVGGEGGGDRARGG